MKKDIASLQKKLRHMQYAMLVCFAFVSFNLLSSVFSQKEFRTQTSSGEYKMVKDAPAPTTDNWVRYQNQYEWNAITK